MSITVESRIDGLEGLQIKLQSLGFDMAKKGGRHALRKAAMVIRDKAIEGAKQIDDTETAENISKNIVERWNGRVNKQSGGNDMAFRVGVLGGASDYSKYGEIKTKRGTVNPGGDTFHWRFVEFGTEGIAAKPFMRPAIESTQSEVLSTFIKEYDKAIDRVLARAAKKARK